MADQYKAKKVRYYRQFEKHRNGPLTATNLHVRGKSESAVVAELKRTNKNCDIIIVSIEW